MERLRPLYFIAANTAILLVAALVGTHVAIRVYEDALPLRQSQGHSAAAMSTYSHMTQAEVEELWRAHWHVSFRYEPVVGFTHAAIATRFVNIDGFGIRANGPAARGITALDHAIWFLGGSSTFGEGVADHETIPAQLEQMTGRPVINLGIKAYGSAEENLLFNHYLRLGYRPSLALFLDGINEGCEPQPYEDEMRFHFSKAQRGYTWEPGGPVAYAYGRFRRGLVRWFGAGDSVEATGLLTCVEAGRSNQLRTVHARLLAERAALCRLYEVECRTLVQPFTGVHGRRDGLAEAFLEDNGRRLRAVFEHLESNWRDAGTLFLTDVLDGYDRHPFVDDVHYSADASRLLAGAIAERVLGADGR